MLPLFLPVLFSVLRRWRGEVLTIFTKWMMMRTCGVSSTDGGQRSVSRRAFLCGALTAGGVSAVAGEERWGGDFLPLPLPVREGGGLLMEALASRASTREFSGREVGWQELSNLLWAAFGVNREVEGKRTAPSAMDNREVEIWVLRGDGIFRFDAVRQGLEVRGRRDIRGLSGGQDYVRQAPVSLVYVVDPARQRRVPEDQRVFYAAADTGFIAQNVYLYCASAGLGCVVHAISAGAALREGLGIPADWQVVLGQCVGYPA